MAVCKVQPPPSTRVATSLVQHQQLDSKALVLYHAVSARKGTCTGTFPNTCGQSTGLVWLLTPQRHKEKASSAQVARQIAPDVLPAWLGLAKKHNNHV